MKPRAAMLVSGIGEHYGPPLRVTELSAVRDHVSPGIMAQVRVAACRIMRVAWLVPGSQVVDIAVPERLTVADVVYAQLSGKAP
jgi:hypothetical protein